VIGENVLSSTLNHTQINSAHLSSTLTIHPSIFSSTQLVALWCGMVMFGGSIVTFDVLGAASKGRWRGARCWHGRRWKWILLWRLL